ncbi:MAG: M56 family metallopeptidase [Planctomycetota bacterium]|nr:M56 family metallopeptidase [Planctomycetota bacterium]MDE2217385.1 M56 family metallopeptidase [Planctomycetota bacterium]
MKYLSMNQQEKAQLYFVVVIFINLSILSVIGVGTLIGVKGYISDTKFTYETVTCCGSICSKCFFTLHTFSTVLPWVCIVVLFLGTYKAIYKILFMLSRNYRFVRFITPLSIENHPTLKKILIEMRHYSQRIVLYDSESLSAFTLGILKPTIYLSTGICSQLTTKELLAVILHEIHHRKDMTPLKLFVMQLLYSFNFFLSINHYLLNLYSASSEKAADDTAISISKEPLELASALVKLSKSKTKATLSTLAAFSGGQRVVEERIKRLLESNTTPHYFNKIEFYLSCLLSLFFAVTIWFSLFHKPFIHAHASGCRTMSCHMPVCG